MREAGLLYRFRNWQSSLFKLTFLCTPRTKWTPPFALAELGVATKQTKTNRKSYAKEFEMPTPPA